jgi:hypothetical protein
MDLYIKVNFCTQANLPAALKRFNFKGLRGKNSLGKFVANLKAASHSAANGSAVPCRIESKAAKKGIFLAKVCRKRQQGLGLALTGKVPALRVH